MDNEFNIDKSIRDAQDACRTAIASGADQAEVWIQRDRTISVVVENNRLRSCEEKDDPGYCIRAIRNGAVGYARGQIIGADALSKAAGDAAENSSGAQPDPDFVSLPQPGAFSAVEGLHDEAVAALTPSSITPWAMECVEAALAERGDVALKADISVTAGSCAIVNSLGVAASEDYSFVSIGLFAIVRDGDDVGSYYDFTRGRRLADLKPHAALAASTARRAASFLGSCKIPTGEMQVVLGPLAAFSLISSVLEASDGESVFRGRSFLAGKKGTRIAPDILTVTEDPLHPFGLSSSAFDAEGFARAKRDILSGGTLGTYLHNATSAGRAKEPMTGHAERAGYMSGVSTGLTNMAIAPGGSSQKDIISSVKNGLFIDMGSLAPNTVSGALSGTVDYGYLIENGELACPVANAMVGGHIFDVLNAIEAVSSDYREEPGNIMPSMLIEKMMVAGS